ncbi:hypothetical protein Godav_029956, partial [Gossypium davidsonii]|nr:hypothetical protein [Gossypium davidsonii]MBA0669956.1 hypothetical protein [Gossypium klotzschianum]
MNIFVALLCACIVIGHLLEENSWMNESITALIILTYSKVGAQGITVNIAKIRDAIK